jgi:glyoxylase-like metal-dependent hydrolase (beta-lactamase superfamily II)
MAAVLVAAALAGQPGAGARGAGADEVVRSGDINVRGLRAADFPRVQQLATNVYTFEQIDPTKRTVTANNLVVVTAAGVLVAEGQGTDENVRKLIDAIRRLTPQPIKYVVVGSEHGDHTGGDEAFGASVTFLVHPKSKPAVERRLRGPVETVAEKRVLALGATEVDVLFLGRAHTGGDLEVYLPQDRILFMSEVFSNRIFPSMANSYPSEWIGALRKAEEMRPVWFVPAHGFVDSAPILAEEERNYRGAIERVLTEGKRLHDRGVDLENAAASAVLEPYDAWTRAGNNAFQALKRVYLEVDGGLR